MPTGQGCAQAGDSPSVGKFLTVEQHGVVGVALAGRQWQAVVSGEEERLQQWWVCPPIVGLAVAQRLHSGIVGARGGRQACCGVGEAVVGPQ
jgi:hypothetical protein